MHPILISDLTVLKSIEIGGLLCFLVASRYAEFMEIIFLQSHFRFGMWICTGKKPSHSLPCSPRKDFKHKY